MIVTAWILFVFFTLVAIAFSFKLFTGSQLNWLEFLILFVSVFIVAIAAGVLFGGLTLL